MLVQPGKLNTESKTLYNNKPQTCHSLHNLNREYETCFILHSRWRGIVASWNCGKTNFSGKIGKNSGNFLSLPKFFLGQRLFNPHRTSIPYAFGHQQVCILLHNSILSLGLQFYPSCDFVCAYHNFRVTVSGISSQTTVAHKEQESACHLSCFKTT